MPQSVADNAAAVTPSQPSAAGTTSRAASDAGTDASVSEPTEASGVLCLPGLHEPAACRSARKAAFGRAICSCGDIIGTGVLSTQAVHAAVGSAGIATDSSLTLRIGRRGAVEDIAGEIDGPIDVGGLGPSAISGSDASIRGDLSLAGELTFAGNIRVAGSVYSRSLPRGSGALQIDGDLHYADERLRSALAGNVQVGGDIVEAAYAVEPACGCSTAYIAELLSAVAAAESSNDNAQLQLERESMSNLTAARSFDLRCGRYYFRSVSSLSSIDWHISGHVVVVVANDFVMRGELHVTLDPGAELDVLVGGNLLLSSSARFGDPERPAASRVFVRGAVELATAEDATPISAASGAAFVGNLYAPAATLQFAPHSEVFGSLFVMQLRVLQSLLVHYDPAVTSDLGAACEK
ncbi:MAG TPA: hypothetical protein VFN67_36810 [Polyangiales bacterium]|nr:hypothetical protein [Polyangiales bacterium]